MTEPLAKFRAAKDCLMFCFVLYPRDRAKDVLSFCKEYVAEGPTR